MHVWAKVTGLVLLMPVVVILLVALSLYVPTVQNLVARKAMNYVSETVGWDISFERIHLAFPLKLSVRQACIKGTDDDTMAFINRLSVDVRLMPLMKGYLSVRKINMEKVQLNTGSLLDGMVVQGTVGKISLNADSINFAAERIDIKNLAVSNGEVRFFMCDTASLNVTTPDSIIITEKDTVNVPINLYIALKKVALKNITFNCRMPCDSIFVDFDLEKALLSEGFVDLNKEQYGIREFYAKINTLSYQTDESEAASGLDISHIYLSDVSLLADSLYYDSAGAISAIIRACAAKERSGLSIRSLTGRFDMDSLQIEIPAFDLETTHSTLRLQALIPWSSLKKTNDSQFTILNSQFSIYKHDIQLLLGDEFDDYWTQLPDTTLVVEANIQGNVSDITINKLEIEAPGAFQMQASGAIGSFDDEQLRSGRVDFSVQAQAPELVAKLLQPRFRMPDSLCLNGFIAVDKGVYSTEMTGRESDGSVLLSGHYNVLTESYELDLKVDSLEPQHFMPDDSLYWLSASVYAKGKGTDPYHTDTQAKIDFRLNEARYGQSSLTGFTFSGSLNKNQLQAELKSAYPLLKGIISVDGVLQKEKLKGLLIMDVDSIDIYGLGMMDSPLSTSFQLFSEFETDLEKTHSLDVTLGNWNLNIDSQVIKPKMITMALRSEIDTTRISFYAGDINIHLHGNSDLETLIVSISSLANEAEGQLKRDSMLDFQALRSHFPDMSLRINADKDNSVSQFLQSYNTLFEHFELEATISQADGLNVNSKLLALIKDTLRIDTIRLKIWQDMEGFIYEAGVMKNRFRNQDPFKLNMSGSLRKDKADLFVSYLNSRGEKGLHLGVQATKASDGYIFSFYPEKPVIAYLPFTINENNFFRFKDWDDIDAYIRLRGDNYSSIWIHTEHQDEDSNELMVEIDRLNLDDISAKFTSLPSLKGFLNVTCRYLPVDNTFKVVAKGSINDLYYERSRIGEILIDASWKPVGNGTHQLDLHTFHDLSEIITLSILYQEEKNREKIDGFVRVDRFPLSPFNAMIPERTVQMQGFLNGKLEITGTLDNPELSGELKMDKVAVTVIPASTAIYFDDQPVKMNKNRLIFEKFKIYTQKDNPLLIEGSVDATNTSRPVVDLRMSGSNLQLFDSRRTPESLLFGRMFVNFNSTLTGPMQSLRIRGNLRVLGNSNFTYIMVDSPLEVEDNFGELVTFTYFADTIPGRSGRPFNLMRGTRGTATATGTDMLLNVSIDPVVRLRIDLDPVQSNFVEIRGGGELALQYTTQNNLRLNGRYTLSEGALRYSIPVIPLTDFSVRNGSYIDWSGDPMNPYLNISAYTRARSSVNLNGESQMVDFNAGIQLRDNLNDVSVQFLLEAPTNATIQNQLTSMGAEERSKQAISLLVTGVYLASEGTDKENLDVGAALSSLLQREVKNILGNLLGDMPVSFDVITYDGTQGMGRRVDYIGRFYKDFFKERFNTAVGLRFSTADRQYGNKFFPEDISLGYRLDMDGSRSVQVFRSREYENTFEGEIVKYGVGFTIRKKLINLKDLFAIRKRETIESFEKGK